MTSNRFLPVCKLMPSHFLCHMRNDPHSILSSLWLSDGCSVLQMTSDCTKNQLPVAAFGVRALIAFQLKCRMELCLQLILCCHDGNCTKKAWPRCCCLAGFDVCVLCLQACGSVLSLQEPFCFVGFVDLQNGHAAALQNLSLECFAWKPVKTHSLCKAHLQICSTHNSMALFATLRACALLA